MSSRPLAAGATLAALASIAGCGGGGGTTNLELDWAMRSKPAADSTRTAPAAPTTATATPVSLALTRSDTTLVVAARLSVGAVVRDSAGRQLADRPVAWASSDTTVVAVAGAADPRELRAVRPGQATITVTLGTLRQALRVVVEPAPPPPVAAVRMTADSVVALGDSLLVRVEARDAAGQPLALADRRVWWYTDVGPAVPLALGTPVGATDTTHVGARWVRGAAVGAARVAIVIEGQTASALVRVAGPAPTPAPRVSRILLTASPATLTVGGDAIVTAVPVDSGGQVVLGAALRLQSANPAAGIVTQDSVGTGSRAGIVFGTLHALTAATFSVTAETRDRGVFAQAVVVTRPATP